MAHHSLMIFKGYIIVEYHCSCFVVSPLWLPSLVCLVFFNLSISLSFQSIKTSRFVISQNQCAGICKPSCADKDINCRWPLGLRENGGWTDTVVSLLSADLWSADCSASYRMDIRAWTFTDNVELFDLITERNWERGNSKTTNVTLHVGHDVQVCTWV